MELVKLCPAGHINNATAFVCKQCSAFLNSAPIVKETEAAETNQPSNLLNNRVCAHCGYSNNVPTSSSCQICLNDLDSNPSEHKRAANATRREVELYLQFPFGIYPMGNKFKIGREADYSIISKELEAYDAVSRRHAEFSVSGMIATVTDVGSTNRVLINGKVIEPHVPVIVKAGDEVSFGRRLQCVIVDKND
jgi:FHA domain